MIGELSAELLMTDEKEGASSKIQLSTIKLVTLLAAMGMVFGLLGYGLSTLGRTVIGGDVGEWIGLMIAFAVLCLVCWIIAKSMWHRSLGVVCAVWVCLGVAKVGEEIGKDLGGDVAPKWGGVIGFLLVFFILILLGNLMKGRVESSQCGEAQ